MQKSRFFKLRFHRRLKLRQQQVKKFGDGAERSFDTYVLKRLDRFKSVRRFVFGWVALILVMISGLILQTVHLGDYYLKLQPVAGGTYREGILGTFSTANPLYATSDVDTAVSHLLFASLFHYDQHNKLVGDLASSYEVNATGTQYTVHLKPHLRWHDGQPLTSKDIAFTYHAIQNPDAQSPLKNSWQGITITATDSSTIVFSLPGPLASFANTMTNGIVPEHRLAATPASQLRTADFNTINPVGAGPFMWQSIQVRGNDPARAEEQLSFLPFKQYSGGTPKLEHFVIHAYADRQQLIDAFRGGAVTGLAGLSTVPPGLQKQSSVQVHNFLLTAGTYVFFKTTQPILADQKVRLALVQAANPNSIIKQLSYPTKQVRGPLLTGQLANDASITQPKPNLDAAKATLTADGWLTGSNGQRSKDKKVLSFNLVATDTPENRIVAATLQRQWQDLGVKLRLRLQSSQNFQNTLTYHDYDAVIYSLSIGPDPDVFVYWDSSQADIRSANRLNLSEYKNLTADASLESGRTRLDPALRTLKYKPFLQAWQQDLPALGLYQPRVLYLTNTNVSGLSDQTVNTATDRYNNVQNWMIRQAKVSTR